MDWFNEQTEFEEVRRVCKELLESVLDSDEGVHMDGKIVDLLNNPRIVKRNDKKLQEEEYSGTHIYPSSDLSITNQVQIKEPHVLLHHVFVYEPKATTPLFQTCGCSAAINQQQLDLAEDRASLEDEKDRHCDLLNNLLAMEEKL